MLRTFVWIAIFVQATASAAFSQTIASQAVWDSIPEIRTLAESRDPLFKQHQELVALFYQAYQQKKPLPDLVLFRYRVKPGDTLFTLSSRFNLPYESIATLNAVASVRSTLDVGADLLIPSQGGLFVSLDAPGIVDQVMTGWRTQETPSVSIKVPRRNVLENVLYLPGQRFHDVERAFFLGILFRLPLPQVRLTSNFGMRISPFTGHPLFHNGIDLGAPYGTDVYAARDGVVKESGNDRVLGNFVKLDHGDGYETVYGHLSSSFVSLNQNVKSGTLIGKVGSTGLSTGPHLHFEVRRKGHPEDPIPLLPTHIP